MTLKISEMRTLYGYYDDSTDAERQAAYEALLTEKTQEIIDYRDLYNSDKTTYAKYKKFSNFTDADCEEYAALCLKQKNASALKASINGLSSVETDPELAKWVQFSYEEILAMESDGVNIPKEVVEWAHSMQDSDAAAYEIEDTNTDSITEESSGDSLDTELKDMQKKTLTLSSKSETTRNEINTTFEEFKETSKKAEQVKREQEDTMKDSLKQIGDLTKEWETITAKVKNGSKLSESEKNRYKELGSILNGQDGELMSDILSSSDELQDLIDAMDGLSTDIDDGIELGTQTVDMAKQLSLYEKGYGTKNVAQSGSMAGTAGEVKNLMSSARGQGIAETALDNGNNLIEFSYTLDNTLMMNQYASLYEFAEIFTESSEETVSETKDAMGSDFDKTSEEINEEIDALPDMSAAENERWNMEQQGVSLIKQALIFTGKSAANTVQSIKSIKKLNSTEKQAEKEKNESQKMTDSLVDKMEEKKEEVDKLVEKKEKAEAKEEKAEDILTSGNIEKAQELEEEASDEEDEFTEEDQERLDSLNEELKKTGERGQQKLYKALSKIDGLEKFLQTKSLDGLDTIDYGEVTQDIGLEVMKKYPPVWCFIYLFMIGVAALAAGTAAEVTGKENNKEYDETSSVVSSGKTSIGENQISVQNVTNVEGISLPSTDGNSEESSAQETGAAADETGTADTTAGETAAEGTSDNAAEDVTSGETNETASENPEAAAKEVTEDISSGIQTADADTAADSDTTAGEAAGASESSETGRTVDTAESSDSDDDDGETTTDEAQEIVDKANESAEEDNKDTLEVTEETEKDEEQIEKEMKALQKNIKKDNKELEKITKEAQNIAAQKVLLAAEFDELNKQNEEIMAGMNSQQTAAPVSEDDGTQQPQMAVSGDDTSTLMGNQARQTQISEIFKTYDQKLMTSQTKIRSISAKSTKRSKKFDKLARQKQKLITQRQKAEEKKQARLAKSLAIVGIQNNLFSLTATTGTILMASPFTYAAGAVLFAIGTYGMAACAVTKATILIATGNLQAGLMTLGAAAIQIAASMVGAGGAASAATATLSSTTQIVGAGLSAASSIADTVAQVQTLQGKESSGWLNTVSSIAGAASAVTNVAGGFVKGANGTASAFSQASTLGKVSQVAGAVGTAATTTAQISTLIKQANGEEAGNLEAILGIVGYSMSTAASAVNLVSSLSSSKSEKTNDTKETKDDNKTENTEKTDETENDGQTENTENTEKTGEEESGQTSGAATLNSDGTVSTDSNSTEITETEKLSTQAIEETEKALDSDEIEPEIVEQIEETQETQETDVTEEIETMSKDTDTDTEKKTIFQKIGSTVKSALSKVKEFAKNTFASVKKFVIGAANSVANFVKNAYTKVKNFAQNTVEKVKNMFKTSETDKSNNQNNNQNPDELPKQAAADEIADVVPDNEQETLTENSDMTSSVELTSPEQVAVEQKEFEHTEAVVEENIDNADDVIADADSIQVSEDPVTDSEAGEEAKEEPVEGTEEETPEESVEETDEEDPAEKEKQAKKETRRKKMEKISNIAGKAGEVLSNGAQIVSAIDQLNKSEEEVESSAPSWDMRKGLTLMRKIKKRREDLTAAYQSLRT